MYAGTVSGNYACGAQALRSEKELRVGTYGLEGRRKNMGCNVPLSAWADSTRGLRLGNSGARGQCGRGIQ